MMKVTQTVQATDPDGNPLDFANKVDMVWYRGNNLIEVASAVTQILADSEDRRFTRTIAIHVELV